MTSKLFNILQYLGISRIRPRLCRGGKSNRPKIIKTITNHREDKYRPIRNGVNKSNLIAIVKISEYSKCSTASQLTIGLLNCQSVRNKCDIIVDYLLDNKFDIMFLTETWLSNNNNDDIITSSICPTGYNFKHSPRTTGRGGGVGILYKSSIKCVLKPRSFNASSYENFECYFKVPGNCIHTFLIYRPLLSSKNKISRNSFIDQFSSLLESATILPAHLLILGDLNINWMNCSNNETAQFHELLDNFNLKQHVSFLTHRNGHTLDHIITRSDDNIIDSVSPGELLQIIVM